MSQNVLQQNLERLLKDRKYPISELERRAGQKRNSVYNILRGISKKPSAELLQSVADVLGVTVKDLYNASPDEIVGLGCTNLELFANIVHVVVEELKELNIKLSCHEITNVINEVYNYCSSSNSDLEESDRRFVKWLINQKSSKLK